MSPVQTLLAAKAESDRRNYRGKHALVRRLMAQAPADFFVDSREAGIYGLTHAPSGFRFHLPAAVVPAAVLANDPVLGQASVSRNRKARPKAAAWDAVPAAVAEYCPRATDAAEKSAAEAGVPLGHRITNALSAVQRPFGGPNALTYMLTLGGAGALAGYGAGRLYDALTPDSAAEPGHAPKSLALTGGLAGLGLGGLTWGAPAVAAEGGLANLVNGWPKSAYEADAAGGFHTDIPVDLFNDLVITDELTPRPVQAATAGLTEAASYAAGGARVITPLDIARVAVGMGSGAVSGLLVGRVLGSLAGLTPEYQQKLRDAGMWAGALTNSIPLVFGGQR